MRILCTELIQVSYKVKVIVSEENRASSVRNIQRRESFVKLLTGKKIEQVCIIVLNFASFYEVSLKEFNESGRFFPGSCYMHLSRK